MSKTGKAVIFDIQRFSLHDGPGIRMTVFFKGCPLRCAWCQNPESWGNKPEIAFYQHLCRRCFNCLPVCEEKAIVQHIDRRVEHEKCTICGKCTDRCVDKALRVIGWEWTVNNLVDELVKDADYFEDSGGGVTLSGGEPLHQAGFLKILLPELKNRQIHVNIETCGLFAWQQMENLLPHLDLVFYDLKMMDNDAHTRFVGMGNGRILENFITLSKETKHLQARMPVIPGVNDNRENIVATARFLKMNDRHSIHCLPYHNMGEAKIPTLNTRQKSLELKSAATATLSWVKALFQEEGVEAVLYE